MPRARGHEAPWDGVRMRGAGAQPVLSLLGEQQRVPRSEMGLLSKIHTLATQRKSRRGLFPAL